MDRYAGRRPTHRTREIPSPRPSLRWLRWLLGFQAGCTGAPLAGASPRPHRQSIVVRASRLHGAGLEGRERSDGPLCRPEAYTTREIPSPHPSLRWLRWLLGFSSRVHRRATPPRSPRPHRQLIVVRASRLHGAGLEGERAVRWTAMQAGGLHHKRDSLPAPLSPVAPLVVGLFKPGLTGAPLVPRSPRPHRQLIVVRASRLHGAGLEGERAVRWTAMQAGGLHHKRDSLPAPLSPVAPLVVGLFKPGAPARHSSRGPRARVGS